MRAGVPEGLFAAFCFAAATSVPFLDAAARARLGVPGMPPLLFMALAAVAGAAALWALRRAGFFAPVPGLGLGLALRWGVALALVAVLVDLAAPLPQQARLDWSMAWLCVPPQTMARTAFALLVPLALAFALIRRARPAMLAAALVAPALVVVTHGALPHWQQGALAAQAFALALAGVVLLRRHGIAALVTLALTHDLSLHALWATARQPLLFGGP